MNEVKYFSDVLNKEDQRELSVLMEDIILILNKNGLRNVKINITAVGDKDAMPNM